MPEPIITALNMAENEWYMLAKSTLARVI